MRELTCFKAYDIRGKLGVDLDENVARRIGRAFAEAMNARRVVIGRDSRATSPALMAATIEGLRDFGADVLDLGLCGTEEMYFATSHFGADCGIEITASHNPIEYNGMKFVRAGSAPLVAGTDLARIRALAEMDEAPLVHSRGKVRPAPEARAAYVGHILSMVDLPLLRPMKVLVNAGNGAAGPTFDALAKALRERGAPFEFLRLHHDPDGAFPNGIPNPMLPENQSVTSQAVLQHGADIGVAWDGDFDRCFLFDHRGRFVPGEYIVGLLASAFLAKEPGATIVHDARLIWNTQDQIRRAGGNAVMAPTGHVYMKQAMRSSGAIYGGEMSAHHYFRDFMACDSGMIPWLLVVEGMSRTGKSLSDLVADRVQAFPSSGEINFRCRDIPGAVHRVEVAFAHLSPERDDTDGMSLSFENWRMNLRGSNTEPLLRLNIEAKGQTVDIAEKVRQVRALIDAV